MENTLRYLLHHMRCGVYVRIQCNRLAMFVPFVNTEYRYGLMLHRFCVGNCLHQEPMEFAAQMGPTI